jgi:hypothetical protein
MNGTLSERIAAIRLPVNALASAAGVHPETVYRLVRGGNKRGPLHENHEAIQEALTAEEIRLRDYLVALHGIPQGEGK